MYNEKSANDIAKLIQLKSVHKIEKPVQELFYINTLKTNMLFDHFVKTLIHFNFTQNLL